MSGADFDGADHLGEVNPVALGEQAPFVEEGQDAGTIGVLDDLSGLGLDRAVHDREGKFRGVKDIAQETLNPGTGFVIATGTDAPEIADARDVFLPRHNPLEAVGQDRLGGEVTFGKGLLENRPRDEFGCAGRDRGFNQDQT